MKVFDDIVSEYWKKFERYLVLNYQKPIQFLITTTLFAGAISFLVYRYIFPLPFVADYFNYFSGDYNQRTLLYSLWFFEIYLLTFEVLYQKVKYPKSPKNKIGVFMAISNRMADEETKSFIKKINCETERILNAMGLGNIFKVVYLDEFKSTKIISEGKEFFDPILNKSRWIPNLNASRWSFLLFGDFKKGNSAGSVHYRFEPNYAVRHKTIPILLSAYMGADFNKILKAQNWQFPISDDLMALDIIAGNVKENVLYALGVAAFVSDNINVAVQLHQKLYDLITPRVNQEDYLNKLYSKLGKMLADENFYLGIYYLKKGDINEAIAHQEKAVAFKPTFYYAHINLAQHYYLKGDLYLSEVEKHIDLAEKCSQDTTYKLSKGYIKIDKYKKYTEGVDLYLEGLRARNIPKNVLENTVAFLQEQKKNQNKLFCDFLIGLIFYFGLDKKLEAKKHFSDFALASKNMKELNYLIDKAQKYINT